MDAENTDNESNEPIWKEQALTLIKIEDLMLNSERINKVGKPPVLPQPGYVYIFDISKTKKSVYACDMYQWRNKNKHPMGKITKTYFYSRTGGNNYSADFTRSEYVHADKPDRLLVHYQGDCSNVVSLPHGNAKNKTRIFVRNSPVVRQAIEENQENLTRLPPAHQYRFLATLPSDGASEAVSHPRNRTQISNMVQKDRRDSAISECAWYAVNLMAKELFFDGKYFVQSIRTHSTFCVELVCVPLMEELNKLLKYSKLLPQSVVLIYDTKFNMGDFYVSPLVMIHKFYDETPVIPLAYMIHQNKDKLDHRRFIGLLLYLIRREV